MASDQDFKKVIWISKTRGGRTADYDHEKPDIIIFHGPWSNVDKGPK